MFLENSNNFLLAKDPYKIKYRKTIFRGVFGLVYYQNLLKEREAGGCGDQVIGSGY